MRTFAMVAGALMLFVHASSAMAQAPEDEGYPPDDAGVDDAAPGYGDRAPPVDQEYRDGAPYSEGSAPYDEGSAPYDEGSAPYSDETPYDEGTNDGEAPSDRAPYTGARDNGGQTPVNGALPAAPSGQSDRPAPPPAEVRRDAPPPPAREQRRRFADIERGSCGRCVRRRPLYGARPDTGFRPYSDSGMTTSGYVDGYYGTYPEAY